MSSGCGPGPSTALADQGNMGRQKYPRHKIEGPCLYPSFRGKINLLTTLLPQQTSNGKGRIICLSPNPPQQVDGAHDDWLPLRKRSCSLWILKDEAGGSWTLFDFLFDRKMMARETGGGVDSSVHEPRPHQSMSVAYHPLFRLYFAGETALPFSQPRLNRHDVSSLSSRKKIQQFLRPPVIRESQGDLG